MNKKYFFVLAAIFLCTSHSTSAKVQLKDSTEVYNYWAHRGIVEAVHAYMNDYIATVGSAKSEIEGKDKFHEKFIKGIENDELPNFDDISSFLKNNSWNSAEAKLFQPLVQKFKNDAKLDDTFFVVTKPGSTDLSTVIPGKENNNKNWDKTIDDIIGSYNNQLKTIAGKSNQKKKNKVRAAVDKVKEAPEITRAVKEQELKWQPILLYICFFIIGGVIGAWLVFTLSRKEIYSILSAEKRKYLEDLKLSNKSFLFKYVGLFHILKKSKDDYKNKFNQSQNNQSNYLTKELEKLRHENSELRQLKSKTENKSQDAPVTKEAEVKQQQVIPKPIEAKHKLYLSIPKPDGSFTIETGKKSNEERTFYRIEYTEESDIGELHFITGAMDKRAINKLDTYLKPACDIENITAADTSERIIFVSPGKVRLLNDSWVIDKERKVKIKLQ